MRKVEEEDAPLLNRCSWAETEDGSVETSPLLRITVSGIFARQSIPREDDLPKPTSPGDHPISKLSSDQIMCRRRMNTPPLLADRTPGDGYEAAIFEPVRGLVDSSKQRPFYHCTPGKEPHEERAVLLQSIEHYQQLQSDAATCNYFGNGTKHGMPSDPVFGEQVIVSGCDAFQICIGDVFEVEGELSPLRLEVTSPRLCCSHVDKKSSSPFGLKGLKTFCNHRGLGGIFARVLVGGDLRDGMKLIRTSNPNPKWTLANVSMALYGEGPREYTMKTWAYWAREKEELEELVSLEQFGKYEWKVRAEYILEYWDYYRGDDEEAKGEEDWAAPLSGMAWMTPVLKLVAPPIYTVLDSAGCCLPFQM